MNWCLAMCATGGRIGKIQQPVFEVTPSLAMFVYSWSRQVDKQDCEFKRWGLVRWPLVVEPKQMHRWR